MSRVCKTTGQIAFVGAGPGDAGMLTVRAQHLLSCAELLVTDPDVPADVLALAAAGAEVRPAVGEPGDVAKDLVAEANSGRVVVRLVSGDPLTADAVVAEALAVARTSTLFEVVPGVPMSTAVPAFAGVPLGSGHTEADVRAGVDWAALAAVTGPLVLNATASHLAEAASALVEHGLAPNTPVAVTASGTLPTQHTVETTLASLSGAIGELSGPLVVTVGSVVGQRANLSWWESRALYGWKVLVPRTKEQAGAMSDRLAVHGAV
ncbi:MAG: uroporphyrinogen-III C-methyltransferase, partial [Pseudonocardiaceae bacterium]